MNQDHLILYGLDSSGVKILEEYKKESRQGRLIKLREMQKGLSLFSKNHQGLGFGKEIQTNIVKHISLCEMICRRMDVLPEIRRRMIRDRKFHDNLVLLGFNMDKLNKDASRFGINAAIRIAGKDPAWKKASKILKREVNGWWENEVYAKYKY